MEHNDFAELPGGAYTRGFIRCYANHVGLNVEEILAAYHEETTRQEAQRQDASRTRQAGRARQLAPVESHRSFVGVFVAAAFILGSVLIGLVYWLGSPSRPSPPAPIAGAHGTALKARVKKSGALPSIPVDPLSAEPQAAPQGTEPESPVSGEPAPQSVEHLVKVRALETTRVQLTCAGVIEFREDLWVGSERHFPCREPILLSAGNGGAIEYSVDSSERQLLGQSGELVRDREILAAPPAPPGPDGPQGVQRPISTASPVSPAHQGAAPVS